MSDHESDSQIHTGFASLICTQNYADLWAWTQQLSKYLSEQLESAESLRQSTKNDTRT